jgi:hypothetical protein
VPSHDRSQLELNTLGADTSRRRSSRLYPSLGNSAFNDVALSPLASRASERSRVMPQCARLNRHQLRWRAASRALRALVLSIEHGVSSVWSPEFARKPTGCPECKGIRCNDVHRNVIALWTLEQPVLETYWTRCYAFQHHPCLAAGTARALNSREESLGRGHGGFPEKGESVTGLSVTDDCRWRGGNLASMLLRLSKLMVNKAQSSKLLYLGPDFHGPDWNYRR